ncbi:Colicin V production protein, partial [Durusdinium trenchii]
MLVMWYDVVVLAILLFFTVRGAMKGVIWQIAGIAGIVLCFTFAETISAAVGPRVPLEPPLNNWIVLFGSYLAFSFVAFGLARLLNGWVEKAQMKEYNRHLGAVFGFVKGVALSLILTFLVVTVSEDARESLRHSRSGHAAAIIMDRLHPVMPEKLHDALEKYIHQLDPQEPSHDLIAHDGENATGTSGTNTIPGTTNGTPQQGAGQGNDFWSAIRNTLNDEAKRVILNGLSQSSPEDRAQIEQAIIDVVEQTPSSELTELQDALVQAGSRQLQKTLQSWQQSSTGSNAPIHTDSSIGQSGASTTQPGAPHGLSSSQVITEIAAVYSSIESVQQSIVQDIESRMTGVPESVTQAVLTDWLADLRSTQPDPDP